MIKRQNDSEESVVIAMTTFPSHEKARQIGTNLVELQLIACVNLLPGSESIYRWEGAVETANEVVTLMKTTKAKLDSLEAWLQEHHPYDLPEFMVISPTSGSAAYLEWVRESTRVAP